nr:hypothetical protein [Candidatus Omnitrophota bacterium]
MKNGILPLLLVLLLLAGCSMNTAADLNPSNWLTGNTQLDKRDLCARGAVDYLGKSANEVIDNLGQPEYTETKERGRIQIWEFTYYQPKEKISDEKRKNLRVTMRDQVVIQVESPDLKEPKILKAKQK